MTPAARVAAAIELLDAVDSDPRPADLVAGAWLRARRFIGAKDRRALSDRVWGLLRRRARLDWWLGELGEAPSARRRVLADLALAEHLDAAAINALCSGERNAPDRLTPDEWAIVQATVGKDLFHHRMPAWVRGEYPLWLEARLAARFGERLAAEMGALRDEAPVDLRVNTLKTDRAAAIAALAADGLTARPTPLSPIGLRLPARVALSAQSAFRDGLVEVQDEGSQLVAMLTAALPGQAVIDFCAGAGGKTLALAAAMENKGRLVACDVHVGRAERAAQRLRRAGVHNVTRRILEGDHDKWAKRQAGGFDRVLIDAPCSGTGTWRRNPDAKWRLTEERLAELRLVQQRILAQAAPLVRPGGRLVYATCSLLPEENEAQVETFVAAHRDFSVLPVAAVWQATIGGICPVDGPYLHLTPAAHGTDGFFAAILERSGG